MAVPLYTFPICEMLGESIPFYQFAQQILNHRLILRNGHNRSLQYDAIP